MNERTRHFQRQHPRGRKAYLRATFEAFGAEAVAYHNELLRSPVKDSTLQTWFRRWRQQLRPAARAA